MKIELRTDLGNSWEEIMGLTVHKTLLAIRSEDSYPLQQGTPEECGHLNQNLCWSGMKKRAHFNKPYAKHSVARTTKFEGNH